MRVGGLPPRNASPLAADSGIPPAWKTLWRAPQDDRGLLRHSTYCPGAGGIQVSRFPLEVVRLPASDGTTDSVGGTTRSRTHRHARPRARIAGGQWRAALTTAARHALDTSGKPPNEQRRTGNSKRGFRQPVQVPCEAKTVNAHRNVRPCCGLTVFTTTSRRRHDSLLSRYPISSANTPKYKTG